MEILDSTFDKREKNQSMAGVYLQDELFLTDVSVEDNQEVKSLTITISSMTVPLPNVYLLNIVGLAKSKKLNIVQMMYEQELIEQRILTYIPKMLVSPNQLMFGKI